MSWIRLRKRDGRKRRDQRNSLKRMVSAGAKVGRIGGAGVELKDCVWTEGIKVIAE